MPEKTYAREGGELKDICGSDSDAFNIPLYDQLLRSVTVNCSSEEWELLVPAVYDALKGINPRNEIEGMLAAQMIATHHLSMHCVRRAQMEGIAKFAEGWTNQATKLSRSCLSLGTWLLERHDQQADKRQGEASSVEQLKPQQHVPGAAPPDVELLLRDGADQDCTDSTDQIPGIVKIGQPEPDSCSSYAADRGEPGPDALPSEPETAECLEPAMVSSVAIANDLPKAPTQQGSGRNDEPRSTSNAEAEPVTASEGPQGLSGSRRTADDHQPGEGLIDDEDDPDEQDRITSDGPGSSVPSEDPERGPLPIAASSRQAAV